MSKTVGDFALFKQLAESIKQAVVAGQDETSDTTIPVAGLAAGDALIGVRVMNTGVPSQRANSDFSLATDGQLTVVGNAADNTGNYYLVEWVDLT
jgi:hypothetical protein